MNQTVIIGAGLSGLTTGYLLQKAGRNVVIFERTGNVGGLARSVEVDDVVYDIGPHYFFLKYDPRADQLVKECVGDKVDIFDFQISAVIRGRNLAWPPSFKTMWRLPISSIITTLKNIIKHKLPDDIHCRKFMEAYYGKALYNEFLGPYMRKKVPVISPDDLNREWWLQIMRGIDNRYKGASQDAFKKLEERKSVPLILRIKVFFNLLSGLIKTARGKHMRKVLYPNGGMGKLSSAITDKFKEAGGEIILNADDVRLEKGEHRIKAVSVSGKKISDPDSVIWTGSIHELTDQLSLKKRDLPFVTIVLGFIKVNKALDLPPYYYTYYSQPDIVFNRAYFPTIIDKRLAPEGKDGICVEISPNGDAQGNGGLSDPEKMKESIIKGLEKTGLCRPDDVENISLMEAPNAYPVYPLDYYKTLQGLWDELRTFENLWSIGRSAQFLYNNMARSISIGYDLAEHILKPDDVENLKA